MSSQVFTCWGGFPRWHGRVDRVPPGHPWASGTHSCIAQGLRSGEGNRVPPWPGSRETRVPALTLLWAPVSLGPSALSRESVLSRSRQVTYVRESADPKILGGRGHGMKIRRAHALPTSIQIQTSKNYCELLTSQTWSVGCQCETPLN